MIPITSVPSLTLLVNTAFSAITPTLECCESLNPLKPSHHHHHYPSLTPTKAPYLPTSTPSTRPSFLPVPLLLTHPNQPSLLTHLHPVHQTSLPTSPPTHHYLPGLPFRQFPPSCLRQFSFINNSLHLANLRPPSLHFTVHIFVFHISAWGGAAGWGGLEGGVRDGVPGRGGTWEGWK